KIIEVGHGEAVVYPGTYSEFLWSKDHQDSSKREPPKLQSPKPKAQKTSHPEKRSPQTAARPEPQPGTGVSREERKRADADRRKKERATEALRKRIADLESRIAEREAQVKELEAAMASPGFYANVEAARPVTDRHQALMWEVGDLMAQWEALQEHASEQPE